MEMISSVKSEARRGLCAIETDVSSTKCVKRRRRSPSLASINQGVDKPQQVALVDQPTVTTTTTTTTTVKRSSRFRGVSRHRWTGRYEAHLWDKGSWNVTQRKKGKQVYLGAYDEEESAARAYDLAAIKYWGTSTFTNFPVSDYEKEVEIMENVTKEEYLASLRRRSSGFSRGVSKYRGVARHHQNGRWEARIGRVFGNKYLYLGTYGTQEEAAHAYDIAAIEYRGINAVTNFDLSTYIRWLRSDANSLASQDPRTSTSQAIPTTSSTVGINPKNETEFSFNPNSYTMGRDLGISPHKQEYFERKMPLSPTNTTSSPSALGILLRSSMFKDLLEKNSSNETEGSDRKKFKTQTSDDNDEFRGMFDYLGMESSQYHLSSSINDTFNGVETKEDMLLPLFNTTAPDMWNGSFDMSRMH